MREAHQVTILRQRFHLTFPYMFSPYSTLLWTGRPKENILRPCTCMDQQQKKKGAMCCRAMGMVSYYQSHSARRRLVFCAFSGRTAVAMNPRHCLQLIVIFSEVCHGNSWRILVVGITENHHGDERLVDSKEIISNVNRVLKNPKRYSIQKRLGDGFRDD